MKITNRENRSEWTQSKEEIIVRGKNRLADQEIAIHVLHRAEDADNPIPEKPEAPDRLRGPRDRVVMPAKILVHGIVAAAVILVLELADQHIQQGHIGTVSPGDTPKAAVHETAQRKYVDQPFYHRSTAQR